MNRPIVAVLALLGVLLAGCAEEPGTDQYPARQTLKVGERFKAEMWQQSVLYAGWTGVSLSFAPNHKAAVNLFFPYDSETVTIYGNRFRVLDVSDTEITIEWECWVRDPTRVIPEGAETFCE